METLLAGMLIGLLCGIGVTIGATATTTWHLTQKWRAAGAWTGPCRLPPNPSTTPPPPPSVSQVSRQVNGR